MTDLTELGLSKIQADGYLFMLENGGASPPALAKHIKTTRTNTYKLLDRLVEMGLASKSSVRGKLTYYPEDPVALSSLVAEQRNKAVAMENSAKLIINELKRKYKKTEGKTSVELLKGKDSIKSGFEQQAESGQPLYFIKTRADITGLGFETMDYIRKLSTRYNQPRFGITPDAPEAPANPDIDTKSNLTRTWMKMEGYTSPVEWTVSGNDLRLVIYNENPRIIKISDQAVAEAFMQLWQLLDKSLKAQKSYKNLPRHAKRKI